MLDHSLDKTSGILVLEPKGRLTTDDFKSLTEEVDGYLDGHDSLAGILLVVTHVPGWENLEAVVQHMRFIRDHQKRIDRVAVLTDNSLMKIPPAIAAYFAHPEFRVFASSDRAEAIGWLNGAKA